MKTLSFNEFKDELAKKLSAKEDGTFEFQTINRSDGRSYTGLIRKSCAKPTVSEITPVINVNSFYADYVDGQSIDDCVEQASRLIHMEKPKLHASNLSEWKYVRDIIFPRLVPSNLPSDKFPYKKVADLRIIYVIRAFSNEKNVGEGVVTNDLMEIWGKTVDELHEQAMDNLEREEFHVDDLILFEAVSNKFMFRGAVECLNPKVISRYSDYYIIPSSVDEVLFFPKSSGIPVKDIKGMIEFVNNTNIVEEKRLSYNVYEYVNGNLTIAEE